MLVACAGMLAVSACGNAAPRRAAGGALVLFDAPADSTVSLKALDVRFEPSSLKVSAGQVLAISLENDGSLNHDFTLAPLNGQGAFRYTDDPTTGAEVRSDEIDVPIRSGAHAAVRLRFGQRGIYQFWCNVPGHRRAGMRGIIVVE